MTSYEVTEWTEVAEILTTEKTESRRVNLQILRFLCYLWGDDPP